jgi:ABC-type nitrate/sulfonate/bicarbonate transport system permease component
MRSGPADPAGAADRYLFGGLFFVLLILAWEWYGRVSGGLLFTTFSETVVELVALVRSGTMLQAFWISNQAMILGLLTGGVSGVLAGLLIGRYRGLERVVDPYLNALVVAPMAALIPLIISASGIGLFSRVLVVFVFVFPIVVVNTRAGLRSIDPDWIEMARSFGASEAALWRRVLLPGAAPGVMAGIRLGAGRALSGMIVIELLLVAVGLGKLILEGLGRFRPEISYAAILIVVLEAIVLMGMLRRVENRLLVRLRGRA